MSEKIISEIFENDIKVDSNLIRLRNFSEKVNQKQTNDSFSEKWEKVSDKGEIDDYTRMQKEWFLSLYGFENEDEIREYLKNKQVIFDAGCGLGSKTAWLAELAPNSIVVGMDYSGSVEIAARHYASLNNVYFVQGDISDTGLKPGIVDFTLCDQVIMHTENPELTFDHLSLITSDKGEFACYVYAKKALPRELLDDHFRLATHSISSEELWEMSQQLTELGKRLSALNIKFDSPEIPLLGIKGGEYDIQRFIYWNFLKCFYRDDWSPGLCDSTNFDWYSPSNAKRFSKSEFLSMVKKNALDVEYFHVEEACLSGRFSK